MFAFDRSPVPVVTGLAVVLLGAVMTNHPASSQPPDDLSEAQQVAAIDARCQAAVEANGAATLAGVLHPDFERSTVKPWPNRPAAPRAGRVEVLPSARGIR